MKQGIALFEQKQVRKIWYNDQWYFSIIDVIEVLTESSIPKRYWTDLKGKLILEGSEVYEKIVRFKMTASDGKMRETDCFSTERLLRVVQSIPSPKAEPFKQRLAKVGYERIQEIEDPERAMQRMRDIYEKKGYPKNWVEKRERSIAVRHTLTDEWKQRGVKENKEYAILTDEIYQAAFGMTAKEYKQYKGIEDKSSPTRENLRDHMNDLELIFTMLGEASTKEIMDVYDTKGFDQVQGASKAGGDVAKIARENLESKTKKPIVSKGNHTSDISLEDML